MPVNGDIPRETPVPSRYEVQLFGVFRVVSEGGVDVIPHGRKTRALLAWLLLADGEPASRERMAGLLWGERGEDQARASLRQALRELRPLASGEAPLLALDRTQAHAVPDAASSDLDRLRALATISDANALARLIGDRPRELLEDLDGIDPGFDDWLAAERVNRRDERRRLALAVAAQALRTGEPQAARRLALALLAVDAIDEAGARLAMAAAHAQGDRDGVRQVHARLQSALREALGATPSAETRALHQQLMAEAAPLPSAVAAPVALPRDDATVADDEPARAASAPIPIPIQLEPQAIPVRPTPRPSPRAWRLGLLAVALVAVGAGAFRATRSGAAPRQRVVLVQPLRVAAGDDGALALRDGLSTELSRMILGNDATLGIVDPDDPAKAAERGASADLESGADFVLAGDARSTAGVLHADIKLFARSQSAILWSHGFARPLADVDALREEIASQVADVTVCALGGRHPALARLGPETTRLYLGACEQKHGDPAEAAKLLRQVVAREPGFAHAWAMLAAATATSAGGLPADAAAALHRQADEFAGRALALDPAEGEAYYARAAALPGIANWSGRMAVLETGHRLDPDNAPVSGTLAWNLAIVGRTSEAIGFARQTLALDPFSPWNAAALAELLGFSGDGNESGDLLSTAYKRFPRDSHLAISAFRLAALEGDPREALAQMRNPERRFDAMPRAEAAMQALLAARTDPSPANVDAAVRDIQRDAEHNPRIGLHAVQRLGRLGRVDDAYAAAAAIDPVHADHQDQDTLFSDFMAPVRADPRFMTLAARQGLAQIWLRTDRWPDFCNDKALPYDCRTEAKRALSPQARPLQKAPNP